MDREFCSSFLPQRNSSRGVFQVVVVCSGFYNAPSTSRSLAKTSAPRTQAVFYSWVRAGAQFGLRNQHSPNKFTGEKRMLAEDHTTCMGLGLLPTSMDLHPQQAVIYTFKL